VGAAIPQGKGHFWGTCFGMPGRLVCSRFSPCYSLSGEASGCQSSAASCRGDVVISHVYVSRYLILTFSAFGLQCFDAVGWAAGRAPGL